LPASALPPRGTSSNTLSFYRPQRLPLETTALLLPGAKQLVYIY